MNQLLSRSIDGRELISLDGHGVVVRGTLHTGTSASEVGPPGETQGRIGIVFLNSLSLPRTATGDSSVFWAETLANRGYPCLRLDLPGLGDSAGVTPTELLHFINAGEYASITAAKVSEMVERFGFSGVVLAGHCAGTVTALFAAAACLSECKGLILLDPYFHLPLAVRPMVRRGLSAWAMRSRFGGVLSNVYDRVKDVRQRLRGNRLPANANKKLLLCWKGLASTGIPIILFKAPTRKAVQAKPRVGEFDYLNYVLQIAGPASRVGVEMIEQTDHSFANRAGRTAVAQITERWLRLYVPARAGDGGDEATVGATNTETSQPGKFDQYQLDLLRT